MNLSPFIKIKHWIYKESTHFQEFIFIPNDKKKKNSCTRKIISIYYNKLKKKSFKIDLYEKIVFGQKDMHSFSKVISLAHYILFVPTWYMINSLNYSLTLLELKLHFPFKCSPNTINLPYVVICQRLHKRNPTCGTFLTTWNSFQIFSHLNFYVLLTIICDQYFNFFVNNFGCKFIS